MKTPSSSSLDTIPSPAAYTWAAGSTIWLPWLGSEVMSMQAAFPSHRPQYLKKSSGRNGFSPFNAHTGFPSIAAWKPEGSSVHGSGKVWQRLFTSPGARKQRAQQEPVADPALQGLLRRFTSARQAPPLGVPRASQNSWTKHSKHASMVGFHIQTTEASLRVSPAGSLSFA